MNKEQLKQSIEEIKRKLHSMEQQLKDDIEYPIFKRNKYNESIVKFTDLDTNIRIMKGTSNYNVGEVIKSTLHTDTKVWEDVAYDKERDLFDGQPVECWEDDSSHSRKIRFYDAINTCSFTYDGVRGGYPFKNYKAIKPEHYKKWMLEAFETLER